MNTISGFHAPGNKVGHNPNMTDMKTLYNFHLDGFDGETLPIHSVEQFLALGAGQHILHD